MSKNIKFEEVPEPIGSFILEQEDIKHVMGNDGAYYHYADVCKLMKRYHNYKNEKQI